MASLKLVRTIFVSDLHLGCKNCKANEFLAFLAQYEASTIYMIGDIIDAWQLKLGWYWPQLYNDIMEELFRRARLGTTIIYILGNHDHIPHLQNMRIGNNIFIKNTANHMTIDGKRYLILHGDSFDAITHRTMWMLAMPPICWISIPDWKSIKWFKRQFAHLVSWISSYEKAITAEAKGFDGIICGHSHTPQIKQIGELTYMNTGDWVTHCSSIIESVEGDLNLIEFKQEMS